MDPMLVEAVAAWLVILGLAQTSSVGMSESRAAESPFERFALPDDWEALFWGEPEVRALLTMELKDVAALVPAQAGLRVAACPACRAPDVSEPLGWSILKPDVVTCRKCGGSFPNDKVPVKLKGPEGEYVPEEVVEVRPGVLHHYPYHGVAAEFQQYPDQRIYVGAKRDYEVRTYLAKAALYAAVRWHEQPTGVKDPALARLAATIILKCAMVYPNYATHLDSPGQAPSFQPADLPPPYRRGYQTGKWDQLGCLDVPLNLVIAYGLLRREPAFEEAGKLLGVTDPRRVIEEEFFRTSAMFVRRQTEESSEQSLYVYRGMLAVGRLLNDPELVRDAVERLNVFAQRAFYHDGFYREGSLEAHSRILGQLDGWVDLLLGGAGEGTDVGSRSSGAVMGARIVPQVSLARRAGWAPLTKQAVGGGDVQRVSWPSPMSGSPVMRGPMLLGGAGLARLAVGEGSDALDLELRGLGDFGRPGASRLTMRMSVAGRMVLDDREGEPSASGLDRATISHNTAAIDGLNQRETLDQARIPAPGSDLKFHAAEADFQVVVMEDRYAYPVRGTRFRQTLIAASSPGGVRYGVSVFEVEGGRRHDLAYHGAGEAGGGWRLGGHLEPGPASLLGPELKYVDDLPPESGRWFIQAYGALRELEQGTLERPSQAELMGPGGIGVRLHLLGPMPATVYAGRTHDVPKGGGAGGSSDRPALMLTRQGQKGEALRSRFVTVLEPMSSGIARLERVEVAEVGPQCVAIRIGTGRPGCEETVVVNLEPGHAVEVPLGGGQVLVTDSLACRVRGGEVVLAGGTIAEAAGVRVSQERVTGRIVATRRQATPGSWGAFRTAGPVAEPSRLVDRTLVVQHGDRTSRGWTIERVENEGSGAWIYVREEPGFVIDPETAQARYYQFPRISVPGPHTYVVSRMARGEAKVGTTGRMGAIEAGGERIHSEAMTPVGGRPDH
jgi:hypothetical protein